MPVTNRSADEFVRRKEFFRFVMDGLLAEPAFAAQPLDYHHHADDLLASTYFALSDAYKEQHLKPGHRTEIIKQAAITCNTIATVEPIRPRGSSVATTIQASYANAMLAIGVSCPIVGFDFSTRNFDDKKRIYDALILTKLDAVSAILSSAYQNDGLWTYSSPITLSKSDEALISQSVGNYSIMRQMRERTDQP